MNRHTNPSRVHLSFRRKKCPHFVPSTQELAKRNAEGSGQDLMEAPPEGEVELYAGHPFLKEGSKPPFSGLQRD